MTNLVNKTHLTKANSIHGIENMAALLNKLQSGGSFCSCVRPSSCTLCRTPKEQAAFLVEKSKQLKDEEEYFYSDEVGGEDE